MARSSREATSGVERSASWTHTAILLAIVGFLGVAGALRQTRGSSPPSNLNVIPLYLSLIAAEWALVLYVRRGVRRTTTTLTGLLGGRITERRYAVHDIVLGVALWFAWTMLEMTLTRWWGAVSVSTVRPFLAHRPLEIVLWIILSLSAGFAEELVFRGYLLRQFTALTGSAFLATVAQAVVFGVAHGYQGVAACARITLFGILFGFVALWQRRLRPGIVAHALTDIIAGLT